MSIRFLYTLPLIGALALCSLPGCSSSSQPGKECESGPDCATGFCVDNRCVACLENPDCDDTAKICLANACVARPGCAGGQPCQKGICINDLCKDCLSPGDCAEGYACVANLCTAAAESCGTAAICNNHGSCDDSSGTVVCTCEAAYRGTRCESCATGYTWDGAGCVPEGGCTDNASCADGNPCTADTCDTAQEPAACKHTALANPAETACSEGGPGCQDLCDDQGACVPRTGQPCGDEPCHATCSEDRICVQEGDYGCPGEACAGTCQDGYCSSNGAGCGAGACAGTCAGGICSTAASDCGVCCACGTDGLEIFDTSQRVTDCGYDTRNPCSSTCTALYTCGYLSVETLCGTGSCAGHCDGAGSCESKARTCCSSATCANEKEECRGTCTATGTCDSVGQACGNACGADQCANGVCAESGLCHCNATAKADCSLCLDDGSGYTFWENICQGLRIEQLCCPDDAMSFRCCQGNSCELARCLTY